MKYEDAPAFDLGDPGHRYSEALGVIDHALETIISDLRSEFTKNRKATVTPKNMRNMILEGLECRGFAVQPTDPEILAKLKALPLLEGGESVDDQLDAAELATGLP